MILTKAQMQTDIVTYIYTNTTEDITGDILQERMLNMNDSFLNRVTDNNAAGGFTSTQTALTAGRFPYFNTTGLSNSVLKQDGTGLLLDSGKYISSASGISRIDFGTTGAEYVELGTDIGGAISSKIKLYKTGDVLISGINSAGAGELLITGESVYLGIQGKPSLNIRDNSAGATTTDNVSLFATFLGARNSTIATGVTNSVIIGGSGLYGKSDSTAYVNQIGYATGSSFETLLAFDTPSANCTLTIPNKTGNFIVNDPAIPGGTLIAGGTASVKIGYLDTADNWAAIYMNQASPSATNYTIISDGATDTFFNSATNLRLCVADTTKFLFTATDVTIAEGYKIIAGTTTGLYIGSAASEKLGLWGTTPNIQPTNAITAAAFVANTSGIADDTATYGGYTGGQIVAALKRIGALA